MEGKFKEDRGICMTIPYIYLNNDIKIPSIGMGGWAQKKEQILMALESGYRLLDTAAQYGNEEEFGAAIRETEVKREDIFLVTKLWTEDIRNKRVRDAFEESLTRLGTEYVDLYLIHWPAEGYEKAWLEMEKLYREGKIKAIGVSNFEKHHLESLKQNGATIVPSVNQVESHPYFRNQDVIDYCRSLGIIPEAWCPIGGPGKKETNEKIILEIAGEHGKTAPQIILRWQYQRGVIAIPKTSHFERMEENRNIFDFDLSLEEMEKINSLDRGARLGADPDHFDF